MSGGNTQSLFAATILAARKLNEIGGKPCPAWECAISDAISNAELILNRIDERCPAKWSARAVGRRLGVSHTYVQKLVREFATDPSEMQRDARRHIPATLEQLSRAQDETRKQKERGWLRPPRHWRRAEFEIGGRVARVLVPTKAEERRRAEIASGRIPGPACVPPHDLPLRARGLPYYSPDNPCDPLIAVKRAIEESRKPQPVFARRWRPGVRFRP